MSRPLLALLLCVVALGLPGCITFHDREGVAVDAEALASLQRGTTTRGELLARLGPPTGIYQVRPFDAVTRQGAFSSPITQARLDEDVLVWQEVAIDGSVLMLPVFMLFASADVWSRTVMAVLEDDVLVELAVREDAP